MRDHYVGDISDLLKFSLLRRLIGSDRRLGIAWYYVEGSDNDRDGSHLEWVEDAHWESLDPVVHRWLRSLPARNVASLEDRDFWQPTVIFHREPVPHKECRDAWADHKRRLLGECDLIFLDPDNGLGHASQKHASLSELKALRQNGRIVGFITFPKRQKYAAQVLQITS